MLERRILAVMRRLMTIAAFALFLALPLWAQHGGGHAGGGHGGGSAGHAAFSGGHGGGGHVSGGMHSNSGSPRSFNRAPSFSQRSSSRGLFLHDGFRGNRFRGSGNRFRTFGFRNNCLGFACRYGYPWAYGGYYDPYWWWNSGSSYDEDYERDRAAAYDMNEQSLEQQRMLRQEEADGDQDAYAHSAPAQGPEAREGSAPILPDTVLVFRDQHRQEIRNYAIVGQTLWNFSSSRRERIPLADLDLAATAKANDDRGLTFRVPGSGQGQ